MEKIDRPFEVKSTGDNGTFVGYGSVFGELDSYRDIVMPGAFAKSLETFRSKKRFVPILWQHRSGSPIGVYTSLKEDDHGLLVEGQLNMDVQQGRECYSLMKQGALSGLSIGYDTVRDQYDDKTITRKLFEVNLWEISPVTFPAADSARVDSVKSLENIGELEDYLRDACSLSRVEAKTFLARCKSILSLRDAGDEKTVDVKSLVDILQGNEKKPFTF